MTSPPLTDQKPREDPTEGLRVLVADLQVLAGRLELKERIPGLQTALKAAQERVSGPRALVMLLSEHAELKRRFLERLLGPNLALVPNSTTECIRLEYGPEPESTVTMSQQASAPAAPLDPLQSFLSRGIIDDAADPIVDTPRHAMQTIRLPNPTLKGGLAVIDTPVVEGEPATSVLEYVEQADAWIFVLNADHALSEASQALLCRLPERGTRLEIIVENAEALSGEERMAARDRLMQTLRERCNIEAPRLTLVASAATEGDEGSFWHGRFATFHSVMMLRGRERWLTGTQAMVQDALTKVDAEIDLELKSIALGVRHARLRLGMKDLDGLRTRFRELGGGVLASEPAPEVTAVNPQPPDAIARQSRLDWSGGGDPATKAEAAGEPSPLAMLADAIASMGSESANTQTAKPEAGGEAATNVSQDAIVVDAVNPVSPTVEAPSATSETPVAGIATAPLKPVATPTKTAAEPAFQPSPIVEHVRSSTPATKTTQKRGVSVQLSGSLKQLVPRKKAAASDRIRLLKRAIWIALLIAFVCLILWALAPQGFLFGQEPPAEWDYQQPTPALASHTVPAATSNPEADPPQPGRPNSLPDTAETAAPNIPATLLVKHHGAIRTPLVRPIPSDATAGMSQPTKRHHRHLLGLGKLWHWVRHPRHPKSNPDTQ
jgi:hypothetical protein